MTDWDDSIQFLRGMGAAVFYGICSVSMAFLNKILMDIYGFDFPISILVIQMGATIVILYALRFLRFIELPGYTLKDGYLFALPAFFYSANSVLALLSLSHMNVAMYGVVKRCAPMVTLLLSVLVLKQGIPSALTLTSIILLTIGCIIAGYGDLRFSLLGYLCGGLSNVTQALYLLLVQRYTEGAINTIRTLQLNCVNSFPLLLMAAVISGETKQAVAFPHFTQKSFLLLFTTVVLCGILLNYSLFLCTSLTSALTTCVVGGVKALVQTIIGIFTFGGVSSNWSTEVGITLNLLGTLLYVYSKYKERRKLSILGHLKKVASLASTEQFQTLVEESDKSITKTGRQ